MSLLAPTLLSGLLLVAPTSLRALGPAAAPPALPQTVEDQAGIKAYLLAVIGQIRKASSDLETAAIHYGAICFEHGGPLQAAAAEPDAMAKAIGALREAYQRIDSFGYEYIEGIVAGVPSLEKFDVELDSGLPAAEAGPEDAVAEVVIRGHGVTLERAGSLNNYLIEPAVFGTNPAFLAGKAALPGLPGETGLPKPELVLALAEYAIEGYRRLAEAGAAWEPTDADCFQILENMTPTLADYFEEWKEARLAGGAASGGRFVAVSRVSDMRGIMNSIRLTWLAIAPRVRTQDAALAGQITRGYDQILAFVDTVDQRDQAAPLTPEAIDALGSQARVLADQLTAQVGQAAALLRGH